MLVAPELDVLLQVKFLKSNAEGKKNCLPLPAGQSSDAKNIANEV